MFRIAFGFMKFGIFTVVATGGNVKGIILWYIFYLLLRDWLLSNVHLP